MSITTQYDRPSRCRHCNSRLWPFPCCKCVPTMSNDFRTTLPGGGSRGVSGGGSRGVSGGRSNVSGSMMLEKIRSNFRKGGSSNGKRVVSKLTTDGSAGSLSLPTPSPKKRAVLCGVTYRSTRRHRLKGTVNDVRCMKKMLIERFGFSEENIFVLTEEEVDQRRIPTKENILQALSWLVKDCMAGDSLVFFFSGHGVRQQESVPGDEIDGFDETILPVDFKDQGTIIDDKINSIIVRPLPSGATLHAIVDSCHSGTILDLPYVYDYRLGKWIDNKPPSGTFKGTSGGLAISLSACSDEEVASDTSLMSGKFMTGAMTYSFIQAITKKQTITYGELMHSIHEAIKGANSKSSCLTFRRSKLLQEPMLSSSEIFDVNKKLFEL